MDREDFNKLDINTQVDYFNKELKKEDILSISYVESCKYQRIPF